MGFHNSLIHEILIARCPVKHPQPRHQWNPTLTSKSATLGWGTRQDIDYYPYGGVEQDYCGTVGQHYKFTGKERDSESNLDNFGARYYASFMSRFMTPDDGSDQDVSDPQSWNLYAYVRNNPLSNTDPTGSYCVRDEGPNGLGPWHDDNRGGETCAQVDAANRKALENSREPEGDLNWRARFVFSQPVLRNAAATMTDPRTYLLWGGASVAAGGCIALCPAGGSAALAWGRGVYYAAAGLLPAVPSAIQKLQNIGLSLSKANELIESPTTQKLIDTANNGNINYIANVGEKLVRITTDPTGQRIISAGYVQARNIANSIASGRFKPE